jgi:Acyl-CoA synthetases (AMP-forming)/AMP-acid ligases II
MKYVKQTIGTIIDEKCSEFRDREAIVFASDNSRITYGDFRILYDSLAKALYHLGIRRGDRIAIMSVNSPYWLAVQIAASKIGAVLVCLNTAYTGNEMEYVLNHSESTALILAGGKNRSAFLDTFEKICPDFSRSASGDLHSERFPCLRTVITDETVPSGGAYTLAELAALGKNLPGPDLKELNDAASCEEVINIQYTSGTTGKPKAVMSTHYAIVNNALVCGENMRYTPEDRLMLCLPLFHVIGCVLSGILGLLYGSTLVVVERFQTEQVLEYLEKEKCTAINAVPTMFHFLLNSPNLRADRLPALKKGFIAGSYCHPSLVQDIMTSLHLEELSIVYGQTEGIAITQTLVSDSMQNRLTTIGHALDGVEAKIVDVRTQQPAGIGGNGELCVKTEYLMKGYYKNKVATDKTVDQDGWLHTGDLATIDCDGYIKIMGRIKEIIIRGGENISPMEIEDTLKSHQGVQDAVAIGVPDSVLGEEICALILSDDPEVTEEELLEFARCRLARYKVPRYLKIVSEFPVTASGKVQKFILRDQMIQEYALKQ